MLRSQSHGHSWFPMFLQAPCFHRTPRASSGGAQCALRLGVPAVCWAPAPPERLTCAQGLTESSDLDLPSVWGVSRSECSPLPPPLGPAEVLPPCPVLSCPLCSECDTGHPLPQSARLHVLMAVTALKCGSCLKHRGAHLHTGDSFTPTQEGSGPREELPPAEAGPVATSPPQGDELGRY